VWKCESEIVAPRATQLDENIVYSRSVSPHLCIYFASPLQQVNQHKLKISGVEGASLSYPI